MYIKNPMKIENTSMDIIDEALGDTNYKDLELPIVKRMIHTTGDVEYRHIIDFREDFVEKALQAFKSGGLIYTDTNMIASGVNKPALKKSNIELLTLISDGTIRERARETGETRSMLAIDEAINRGVRMFAIGNAPTALFRLLERVDEQKLEPLFIIGVPVGFVGAAESKEHLRQYKIPSVSTIGTKGGSNVACSIINALLYQIVERE